MPVSPDAPLLSVRDLAVSFDPRHPASPRIPAVRGVSMTIYPRQTLAVVGESGCGKSVTALSLLHLLPSPPARVDRGTATFGGRDLLALSPAAIRKVRGGEIAMIFQEPMTSLNPVYTIGDQIIEAILLHQPVNRRDARALAAAALAEVGITNPEARLDAYPHQFSGGMRQRVMIAMALACKPKLLLADEPTTALDVTIQKQILELLRSLKQTAGLAIMLITHDLGVVAENADVVCVMYAGRVVEYAAVADLFDHPLHPYTRALLACIPSLTDRRDRLSTIADMMSNPDARRIPDSDRIPWWPNNAASSEARALDPALLEVRPNHWVSVTQSPDLTTTATRSPDIPQSALATL